MALKDIDATVLQTVVHRFADDPDVQLLASQAAGEPVLLEAKSGKQAISLEWLVNLIKSPALSAIIPLILSLFTGGMTSATLLPLLIKVISQLLGVGESTAKAMLMQSLQSEGGQS